MDHGYWPMNQYYWFLGQNHMVLTSWTIWYWHRWNIWCWPMTDICADLGQNHVVHRSVLWLNQVITVLHRWTIWFTDLWTMVLTYESSLLTSWTSITDFMKSVLLVHKSVNHITDFMKSVLLIYEVSIDGSYVSNHGWWPVNHIDDLSEPYWWPVNYISHWPVSYQSVILVPKSVTMVHRSVPMVHRSVIWSYHVTNMVDLGQNHMVLT